MSNMKGRKGTKGWDPPAWILKSVTEVDLRLGPGVLTRKLQEAKKNGKANKSAAWLMFTKKLAEARAQQVPSRFKVVERPKVVAGGENLEQYNIAPPKSVENSKDIQRALQVQTRDSRRSRKEKARAKQTGAQKDTSSTTSATASPTTTPDSIVIAESSSNGARRGSSVTTKPTDIGPVQPRNTLEIPKVSYAVPSELPTWYTSINDNGYQMKNISKKRPQSLTALEALKACIKQCESRNKSQKLTKLYEELRNYVHQAEVDLPVDKFILKKARILAPETGLPRIFDDKANFPADLRADAFQLYNRWVREDFEQDILRGIITVKGKDRNGDRIDPAYRAKYPTSAKFYGSGDLVLGQWWPTQLCAVRDGAHGAAQAGIFGEKDKGAYSIVLSSGSGYNDTDEGDTIEYSGTDGKNFIPTENTLHLVASAQLANPIRVIRSAQLPKKNPYRPHRGLRYDGLYTVVSYRVEDEEKQIHRFRLVRCAGQDPIRCGEGAARRPTVFEIRAFKNLKDRGL